MKITEIKAQVKTAGRFSIFVDDKYAFSLSDTALLEQKLYIGQELDDKQLKDLKQASDDDKAFGLVLRYASMRPHSEWEIRSYMQRKKVTPALADKLLNKLTNLNLVDDISFAKSWVESRRLLRPTSKRKLQQELRAKRVGDDAINQALAEDEADEQDVLRALIAKKRARYPDDLKLMQYLARQGFKYDDIKSALLEESD
ncbi:MAG TPA: RecX family transcriptional regulator [Candidatus Saccharimonadales bacterium]|nr:RecX family transcriptional regulator [Candidatus Saccharimonadales bacterium]